MIEILLLVIAVQGTKAIIKQIFEIIKMKLEMKFCTKNKPGVIRHYIKIKGLNSNTRIINLFGDKDELRKEAA